MLQRILKSITVSTQEELDAVPGDFGGLVRLAGGTRGAPLRLRRRFRARPHAEGECFVKVTGHAWLCAEDAVQVWAHGHAHVQAHGGARVFAAGRAHVEAYDRAFVSARGRSVVRLSGMARGQLFEDARGTVRGRASVVTFTRGIVRLEQHAHAWRYQGRRAVVADRGARLYDRELLLKKLQGQDGGK